MPVGVNSIARRSPLMVSFLLPLLSLATAAALLASVAGWISQLPWLVRFGAVCVAMVAATIPLWLALRCQHVVRFAAIGSGARNGPLADFLVTADHEMKTPLAGIKAYVELLADGDADDESTRDEFVQGICSQTDRLAGAIEELLERARLEVGYGPAETTVANMA
jgi:signal transduction histidine kinase